MLTREQLRARRKKLVDQMRAMEDQADPETGSMTEEQQAAFDALKAALVQLEAALTRAETLHDLESRGGQPLDGGGAGPTIRMGGRDTALPADFDGLVLRSQTGERIPILEARHKLASFVPPSEQRSAVGFGQFLRALHNGPANDMERRALAEATIGTGGAMVPTPLSATVIDLMRSQCRAFQAGCVTVPMETATLRFARQISDPVGSWRPEAAAINISAPTFDAPTLTAKTWALLVQCSRELLDDAQNLDSTLQNIFAKVAALALDRAILYGDGTGASPVGISNTPGILVVSMGLNGGQITNRQPLLQAVEDLQLANADDPSAAIMSPRTAFSINALVDTLGQPLRPPPSIEDLPMLVTTSASITETQGTATNASSILIGDFSRVFVGLRTALQVSILQERYADTGQVAFLLWMRADVLVSQPASMCRIEGITP